MQEWTVSRMTNERKNCTKCKWLTFVKDHLDEDLPICRHRTAVNYERSEPEAWCCTYYEPKNSDANAKYDLISKTALLRRLDMAMKCEDCPRNADKDLYKCVHNPTSERCSCSDIAQICNKITEFETFTDIQPVNR